MRPHKVTFTMPYHGFRPGDEVRIHGLTWDGKLTDTYIIASVERDTITIGPNAFQRTWFWLRWQWQRAEDWMQAWDERFEDRYGQ